MLEDDALDLNCYISRKELDNPKRFIIPKGTQIIIGELVSESTSYKEWNILNSEDLDSFSCSASNGVLPTLKSLVEKTMAQN